MTSETESSYPVLFSVRSSCMLLNCSSADCRFSVISAASMSGGGVLSSATAYLPIISEDFLYFSSSHNLLVSDYTKHSVGKMSAEAWIISVVV